MTSAVIKNEDTYGKKEDQKDSNESEPEGRGATGIFRSTSPRPPALLAARRRGTHQLRRRHGRLASSARGSQSRELPPHRLDAAPPHAPPPPPHPLLPP